MKRMTSVLFQGKGAIKALALVALFFVGLGNVSAQYMPPADALLELKEEIADLTVQAEQSSNSTELADLKFQIGYLSMVRDDIQTGKPVADAIEDNIPASKPVVGNNGWVTQNTAPANDETEKQEIAALVDAVQDLLSL